MNAKDKWWIKRHLAKKYGPVCQICYRKSSPRKLTLDHIVPKSEGGSDELSNLRLACYPCNYGRHH